jgi:hypothetical protein
MCLKLKEKAKIPSTLVNLIDGDCGVVLDLSLLALIQKGGYKGCWNLFIFFLKKYDVKKTHNMFF